MITFLIAFALICIAFYRPYYDKLYNIIDDKMYPQFIYLAAMFVILLITYLALPKEGFFFEVTPHRVLGRNLPRESIFDGKPITFAFDSIGSGMCGKDGCNSYGMIKGCPNARTYGNGSADDTIL
jgi:hypothetical protein